MTTLAVDSPRGYEQGTVNEYPVIAADIIFEGSAVGLVAGTGHARPLVAGDIFAGFCYQRCDNSAGAAAAARVLVKQNGRVTLPITGVVITDHGQPVYATDDNAFTMSPVSGTFVGLVVRWVATNSAMIEFDVNNLRDPYGPNTQRELKSANYTLDVQDVGKIIFVDTDTVVITGAATAVPGYVTIVNIASFGVAAVAFDPAAADKVHGPEDTGADGGLLENTKATARRGDYVKLLSGHLDGWTVLEMRGIWTIA